MVAVTEQQAEALVVKSEIHLELRPGDNVINAAELRQFDLFRRMKKSVSIEKFPGSIVMRRYHKGEVVFQQGQAGGTAFYVPTAEDLVRLLALELGKEPPENPIVDPNRDQHILSAVIIPSTKKPRPLGLFERWFGASKKSQLTRNKQAAIPNDGPSDIDFQTREAPLKEGNLFGEMSCISFMPRSATVLARVDCWLLEFNRNVFDQVRNDKNHQKFLDEEYRRRTLDTHLRQFEFFQDLDDSQIQLLKDNASLIDFAPGSVICEEGEKWSESNPLDVFIVRNGVVQVIVNANLSVRLNDVRDWGSLCRQIDESQPDPKAATPLPAKGTVALAAAISAPKPLSPMEKMRQQKESAGASGAGLVSSDSPSIEKTVTDPSPSKPSPMDMMRAKQAAKSTPTAVGNSASTGTLSTSIQAQPPAPPKSTAKELSLVRKPGPGQSGPPVFVIKSWLNDHVLQAIHQIAQGELKDDSLDTAQQLIVDALNELTETRDFLGDNRIVSEIHSKPAILRKTGSFPKGFKGIAKDWSELELRTAGRAALSEIFPNLIRRPMESSGPPRVLAYLSRGECVGEMAVVRETQRSATCIAYNHPSTENPRDFGNVELVKIPGSVFRNLMSESPQLNRQVKALAEKRSNRETSTDETATDPDLIASAEFQQMGLFQGSKLLVIDLDSCTRCGDCVQACVDTHDDGVSRLFLDGPRYDRFLVPSACRNCLNPVCMLGCPVGSIGRGENGQIEIFDWCIGCSACADQCPYDSIQMHDMGLIPEESSGWLYANRRSLQDDWYRARRIGSGWMQGESPFRWQGDFLRQWSEGDAASSSAQPLHLCFRHEFRLPKKSRTRRYRISINDPRRKGAVEKARVKTTNVIGVWLNGEKLEVSGDSIELPTEKFSTKDNVLAIEVALDLPAEYRQFVLSACLDAIPELGTQALEVLGKEVHSEMDLVTRKAAVCDLCSHIPSQQPACVNSCPHDAAIRVNPMINFPM